MTTLRQRFGQGLWRLADLVQADDRSRSFRAKACRGAVWSLDELSPELEDPVEHMLSIPGIGSGVVRLIDEFRATGRIAQLDQLADRYPAEVADLRRLPRMTPAILRSMKAELGIETEGDLIAAIESGAVETLRGVGLVTAEKWAQVLDLRPAQSAIPSFRAAVYAEGLSRHLERHLGGRVWVAGAVRRVEEWVATIDLVAEVGDVAAARTFVEESALGFPTGSSQPDRVQLMLHAGVTVGVHLATAADLGLRLLVATGPPEHVDAVMGGTSGPQATEEAVYAARDMVWVPPPARGLPVEEAIAVVRASEIRGDLHLHSDWSPDGRMSLAQVLEEAVTRGYEYVLITDHTSGLRFGGLDEEALARQRESLHELRRVFPDLIVLHGAELNIGRDGELDIDDEALAVLDLAVAGLHSYFDLGREDQTRRVLRALEHPKVKVLAHPTGRRIGTRPAIELDMRAVIESAAAHGVALEVNGHRDRLDLSAGDVALAGSAGALLAANSDGHRVGEMGNIANSVATIQKAGVGPGSVVNTRPASEFLEWAGNGRRVTH